MFDVFYIGENSSVTQLFPFAKSVEGIGNIKSNTKMFWLIEQNIEITNEEVFEFRPDEWSDKFIHVWKWSDLNYGGVYLYPNTQDKNLDTTHHNKIVCKKTFDMLFEKTPGNYFAKNKHASHVWCVDPDYKLADNIDWAPGNFEPNYIHSFHLRGQLEHKYPSEEGGIKLYPRDWKNANIKYHTFLDANLEYPIIWTEDVNDYAQRDIFADDYVWLIDQNHKINDNTLDWVPNPFEEDMIHVFRMPYQLTEKYPMAMGGIRLVPKNWKQAETKIHPACPIEDENYDVFYVDEDEFTADVYSEYAERSKTEWFWIVDREHQFNGKLLFVPAEHEQEYIHVFKIPGHLDFRYPADITEPWDNRCGGIRLVNKNFDITKQKYQVNVVPVRYDIFYLSNPKDFQSVLKKSRTKMCWVIDSEHTISDVFKYVPTKDEQKYLLNFKIYGQLQHKYPQEEGGVYLAPTSYNLNTSKKYKGNLSVKSKEYPIIYVDNVDDISKVTQDCWLIDKEYQIDDDIDWVPSPFEQHSIHTFHVPNQLKHKYPEAMGGVRWVPATWNNEYVVHYDLPVKPKKYPVILVEDPNDYTQAKGECWLVDKEYLIDQDIEWLPSNFEKSFIHSFHVDGQLEHKYPEKMGGIRWVPNKWESAELKIHLESPFSKPVFEKYSSEDEGRNTTTKDWFWVIDPDVDVSEDFDFNYVPTVWDKGKTHVWQKLNPATGRQYDYGGVSLCPKEPQTKGRPKYIREPACTQKEYPVYTLTPDDYKNRLQDVYVRLSNSCNTDMFWVVDAFTVLDADFKFDYYPTQWDKKNIHVFSNEDGEYKNVRLIPKDMFINNEYSDKDIANNSFEHLKLINTIASRRPKWPVIHLQSLEKKEFINAIKDIETPFVWTIDPDVKVDQSVLDKGFMPEITDVTKIHTWQKVNPRNGKVHGYGGLRLWPTDSNYNDVKSDELALNRFKNLQYVKQPGSTSKPYEVVFLSYHETYAENAYKRLQATINAHWIKDIDGIFNAHKAAANAVTSDMFWVVDADADIVEDFTFDYIPDVYDKETVHVWASKNPITGDEYGYGGVKLFNTQQIRNATSWGLDFTTGVSKRFKAMPEVSCVTRFNTDAYSTWRSAFRECVKLALKDDAESKERLEGWLHPVPDAEFRHDAKRGAEEGKAFALKNKNNPAELEKINNYTWLEQQWKQ